MAASPNVYNGLILGLLIPCLMGCSSSEKTTSSSYNYSQYSTYRIGDPVVVNSQNPVFKWPQLSERIHKALNFHLPSAGLDPAQSRTDLIIHYYVISDSNAQQPVLSYQIGWRAEQFLARGERFSEYSANTFVLDFVDASADELVWRGSTTIPFDSEQNTYDQLSAQIQKLVQRYPSLPEGS